MTASITDPGSADPHTCTFNWNDGGPDSSSVASGGTGKALLGRRLGGVRTRLLARAATSGGVRRARARARVILRVEHFTTPAGSWLPDQATLTARGRSFVRRLRGKLVAVAGLR